MKRAVMMGLVPLLFSLSGVVPLPSLAQLPKTVSQAGAVSPNVRQLATGFTVKILVGDTNGSGVIIGKVGNRYRVATNAHVVSRAKSYRIQTPDGQIYQGQLLEKGSSLKGNDLAILTFDSSGNYGVATLADGGLKPDDTVYSAGFPIDHKQLMVTTGTITTITSQPLKGGYQLGYSADTLQGMSGGPLLNSAGQLVGIVGMGKGAALLEAYSYQDESRPAKDVISQWQGMSFAVPVATLNQITGDVAKVPSGGGQAVPKAKNYTGIVKQVDDIAQQVTVRIDAPNGSNGSGTIIGKEGNTYSVLTACHVPIELYKSCQVENLLDNLVITLPDGEKITVKSGKDAVTILNPAIDVAVIRFNASKNYAVATMGNYTIKAPKWLLMTGFPARNKSKQRLLTAGVVFQKEINAFIVKDNYSLENGNELVYTNLSSPGMSGGGVFDTEGRLVGVNTGSEDEIIINEKGFEEIRLGYSLGVPITTFLGIAEAAKFSTQNFPKVANPAVEVNANEIQQIKAQLFRFQVPKSGATVANWVNYGNTLWRVGKYTEAVQAFDRAITLLSKERKDEILAKIYYAKGLSLNDNNQYTEAFKAFQQATTTFPNFPNAWRWQGKVLLKLKHYPEALTAYKQAITKDKQQDFTLYMELGHVLTTMNRYPEALASYGQAINLNSTHPWAYMTHGILYILTGEYELALKDFNQAIKLNPQDKLTYLTRGSLYALRREYELALKDFNQAIKLDPQLENVYSVRGLLYVQRGEYKEALNDYNQVIKLKPKSANGYSKRGFFYSLKGEYELALKDFNQAIKLDPKFAEAYAGRGVLYNEKGEKELALKDFNQAIKLDPKSVEAYFNRGVLYNEKGEKELALKDFNQVILLAPEIELVYYKRGIIYFKKGEKDLALKDFNQAIKLDPQYAEAYRMRGILHADKGEKELALKDYNQAIKLDSQDALAYYFRGSLYLKNGDKELALQDFNQVILLDPQDVGAYIKRGIIHADKGEKELALKDYNQAIKLDPQEALAYYLRGNFYAKNGEKELALEDYKQAIKLDPQDASLYINIGLIYYEKGASNEAKQQFQKSISLDQQLAEPQLALATTLYKQGEVEKAKQLAQSALKLDPKFGDPANLKKNLWGEKLINDTQQMLKALKL